MLKKVADIALTIFLKWESGTQFLNHYRDQFLLHAVPLSLKMEKIMLDQVSDFTYKTHYRGSNVYIETEGSTIELHYFLFS